MNNTVLKISFECSRVKSSYYVILARGDDVMAREYLQSQQTNFKIWTKTLEEIRAENEDAEDLIQEINQLYCKGEGIRYPEW